MMAALRDCFRSGVSERTNVLTGLLNTSGITAEGPYVQRKSSKVSVFMRKILVLPGPILPVKLPGASLKSGLITGVAAAFLLAGCAQQSQQSSAGGVWRKSNTKEYFGQKRYGKASPRVVRNGRRVPKGGGRAIVGKPYRVAGKRYYPRKYKTGHTQFGRASWYGDAFHGRKTANGEIYDMSSISAAHPTMPLPSYARVTNRKNGRSIVVRVNDRGPFHGGRVIDLSKRVADLLDFRRFGVANVKVEYLKPASVAGSDDRTLMASLRTDGSPAQLDGSTLPGRTMIAGLLPRKNQTPAPAPRAPTPAPVQSAAITTTSGAAVTGGAIAQTTTSVSRTAASSAASGPATATAFAPVPLPRPFDLATIPGASTPIGPARHRAANSQPGSAPVTRVTFFAPYSPNAPMAARLRKRGPFQGIDLTRLRLLQRQN